MKKILVITILSLFLIMHHSMADMHLSKSYVDYLKRIGEDEKSKWKKMNYLEKKQYVIKERKEHKQGCYDDDRVTEAETEFAAKSGYKKCVSEFRFDRSFYKKYLDE